MRFFVVFFSVFLLLVVCYLALFRVVDPRSEYGTGKFPAPLANARVTKQKKFKDYLVNHKIDGLVLGSSRSMLFDPKVIDKKTGHVFFNFSVENAMVEDYLAIYRWVLKQGVKPKMLIVGLDVEALNPSDKIDDRLQDNSAMLAALEDTKTGFLDRTSSSLAKASNALTIQSALAMEKGVQLKFRPTPQTDIVEPDGHTEYPTYEKDRAAGTFDLEKKIGETIPGYSAQYKDMDKLSPMRVGRLQELVQEATTNGATVILWVPPLHPETVVKLTDSTPYAARLKETVKLAQDTAAKFPGQVQAFDFSSPDKFGGNDKDWRDGAHMDKRNAARVLGKMLGSASGF